MSSGSPIYQAALIGLGQIAQGYGAPTDAAPYCHAGGILKCPRFDLFAAADPFEGARRRFQEKWGAAFPQTKLHDDVAAMLAARTYDVVAVCVRGPYHQPIMRQVFAAKPRVIFLEKPPTVSLDDHYELVALSKQSGVHLVVSYSRHWGTQVLQLTRLVKEGLIGEVRTVVSYCGGTVLSFASHATQLLHSMATATAPGVPVQVAATGVDSTSKNAPVPPDFAARGYEVEPELLSMHVRYSNGVLATQVGAHGDHGGFYADVFGSKGRVRIGFYGKHEAFDSANKPLELPPSAIDEGPFTNAYAQIASHLDGGPLPDCTLESVGTVNEIGFAAIESIRAGGKPVTVPVATRGRRIFANG